MGLNPQWLAMLKCLLFHFPSPLVTVLPVGTGAIVVRGRLRGFLTILAWALVPSVFQLFENPLKIAIVCGQAENGNLGSTAV